MDLKSIENRHKTGVTLLKECGYYERLLSEIHLMIKYIDNQFFLHLFSENLFSDIRGVFRSFVRQDLRKVYEELSNRPDLPLTLFLEREYMNLEILRKCSSNLRYQVKSLVRLPGVRQLEFKSSFLQSVSRKLNGEIQELHRILSDNYKIYFRQQFSIPTNNEQRVSLGWIEKIGQDFDASFLSVMRRFYRLSDAILFVKALFQLEMENEIRNRISSLFFDRQEKFEDILDYFINDLKKNFIRTLDRHLRSGKKIEWIQKGFEQFIDSTRFESLLRRVIYQTLAIIRKDKQAMESADIF